MAEPIDIYLGEFTVSPVPLEISLNYCSHSCHFCFANLNSPSRTADMPGIMRMLANLEKGKSLSSVLMRSGCPVLVSNRVDPFANSNYQQAVPMLETMTELGVAWTIQTRGGKGIDDVLKFAPPSVWYVSIAQSDDKLRKAIEPGAPSIDERFALIEKLRGHGHRVVVGINPLVKAWLPDPEPVLARAKACGAEGAWVESIHLSKRQIDRITPKGKAAISLPVIEQAGRKFMAPEDREHHERTLDIASSMGLHVFGVGHSKPSDFWTPFRETYETTYPVMQDFVNACWETLDEGDIIEFDTFAEFFVPYLPEGSWPISRYVSAKAHAVVAEQAIPSSMTYEQLLMLIWSEPRIAFCPARIRCFSYAAESSPKGWLKIVDERDMPFLVFTRAAGGTDEYYTEV